MILDLRLSDEEIERIATRLAQLVREEDQPAERWLDVRRAAAHLGLTENAIRGLVKRRRIPFHRTENHRLRFSTTELDQWIRAGACAPIHQDLP